jgi:hypothetical protein
MKRRRDRVVVFRLTEEEYDGLRRICEARSGRSLSEFARSELLGSTRLAETDLTPEQWGSMERRVADVEAGLRDLARRIDSATLQGLSQ